MITQRNRDRAYANTVTDLKHFDYITAIGKMKRVTASY